MTKGKRLIVMLAALAAISAAAVLLTLKPWEHEEVPEQLIAFETDAAPVRMEWDYHDEVCVLIRDSDGIWNFEDDADFAVNQSTTAVMTAIVKSLPAVALIEEDAQDLSGYDLDKPRMTVTVDYDDGSQVEFRTGDYSAAGKGYYITCDAGKSVYLADGTLMTRFSFVKSELEAQGAAE